MAPLPPEGDVVAMYEVADAMLTKAGFVHYEGNSQSCMVIIMLTKAGFVHYEVSNFAKPGHESRHNHVYWSAKPFLGFGVGATSLSCAQRRYARVRTHSFSRHFLSRTPGYPIQIRSHIYIFGVGKRTHFEVFLRVPLRVSTS